jgi:hypothetical protein
MKIKLKMPADAEVTFDEVAREITIEPFFSKSDGRSNLAYVAVHGESGALRRAVLQCSGKSGQIYVQGSTGKRASTAFDKLEKFEGPPPRVQNKDINSL